MIGLRIGLWAALKVGLAIGVSNDPIATAGGLHVDMAGQSNANIRSNSTLVDYGLRAGRPGDVDLVYAPVNLETSTSFTPPPTYPAMSLAPIAPSGLNSGFELGLGRALIKCGLATATTPITKQAIDGTAIATWNNGTNHGRNVTAVRARETAFGRLLSDRCWAQGEADGATAPLAAAYPTDIATYLDTFHTDFPTARHHFLVLNINANPATIPFLATIRAAQIAAIAARSSWCYAVYADDLELGPDGVHYTANSYWSLGIRFAESIRRALGANLPSESVNGAPFVRSPDNVATSSNTVGSSITVHPPPSNTGDTQVLFVNAGNLNVATTLSTTGGFTEITNSPQQSTSGGNFVNLSIYTRVWAGSNADGTPVDPAQVDPVVAGGVTQQRHCGRIIAIGGTSGIAMNAVGQVNNSLGSSAIAVTGITTTIDNCLVINVHASYAGVDNNITPNVGTLTYDGYGPFKQALSLFVDLKPTQGLTAGITATHAANSLWANLALAFKP